MMNKLFLAAGFAASHVLVAHAAVSTRQSQPNDTNLANFQNKCNGKGAICDRPVEHFARCQQFGNLAGEKKCMCGNDYFWDTKKLCDECKMSTEFFDVIDKNHWSNVYDKVRESYCNHPEKTFEAAWLENEKQPLAHDRDVASPALVEATSASSKDIQPPNYKELCSECKFTGTVKISLPTPVRVVNVATVTPSATHVASPVPAVVAAPTSAPFPLNNTNAAIAVPAEVHLYVIRFDCVAVVEICETCTVKYIGSNPQVEHEEKIKNMDVAVVEKKTEVGLVDAGWCYCVENQVLPGTKVTVAGHVAIAGFDRVSEIAEKKISADSPSNDKPVENRKPLPGAGPFSPEQNISYPAPVVCPPAPGKEGQPAPTTVPKGVVSSEVYGSKVFWPSDRLPVSKAASGSNPAAPASGSEAAANPQVQDSTSPKQGSQVQDSTSPKQGSQVQDSTSPKQGSQVQDSTSPKQGSQVQDSTSPKQGSQVQDSTSPKQGSQVQDSTSPKQGSQARPATKTTIGTTAVPTSPVVPATAGVGCLRASAVLAAVAAVAAAL